jgi:uncharacterized protein YlaI
VEFETLKDNTKIDLQVNTISVAHNKNITLFRCPACGTGVAQIVGTVVKIYPMIEPSEEVLVISRCRDCGALYNFQTQVSTKRSIKVKLLRNEMPVQTWFCHVCRNPLLQMNKDGIIDMYDFKPLELPANLVCDKCNTEYNIMEMLK